MHRAEAACGWVALRVPHPSAAEPVAQRAYNKCNRALPQTLKASTLAISVELEQIVKFNRMHHCFK